MAGGRGGIGERGRTTDGRLSKGFQAPTRIGCSETCEEEGEAGGGHAPALSDALCSAWAEKVGLSLCCLSSTTVEMRARLSECVRRVDVMCEGFVWCAWCAWFMTRMTCVMRVRGV